jgi:hypothetical protein
MSGLLLDRLAWVGLVGLACSVLNVFTIYDLPAFVSLRWFFGHTHNLWFSAAMF